MNIEFCEGGSLYDHILEEKEPVSKDQALKWAKEIAKGRCYYHNYLF